ncbi:DUF4160 domain-containing protein [Agrobacterium vitis]|uniref:DUF4160 domain-containing protein n=1 Tax=Agrobacterium vitis TaxID=373 RepID=UPI0015DAF491|nr:DUF4160 domain-containing protein [Agrobacterium vitis]MCF1454306.1 DUF4160 domain-containing protein [Agrobacterium vitis]BCH55044.1 hypothetical protein RvVAR031_26540 [Agrobacterium vitis]
MPVLLRHGPYKFFFYSNEGNPREPIHVHVRSAQGEAKIWLEPTIGLSESFGFNSRELSAIIKIVIDNRAAFTRAWGEYFGN